jgi:DNA-binding GntR family transcriptional regulator
MVTMHGRFHNALIAACGPEWLLRFRSTLYEQSERYQRLGLMVSTQPRDVAGEHRRIYQATMDRDPKTATAELTRHFTRTAEAITQPYDRASPKRQPARR